MSSKMNTKNIHWDLWIGFWLGIAVITLVSIARTALHKNLYEYDGYILGVSIIVLIIILILRHKVTKNNVP